MDSKTEFRLGTKLWSLTDQEVAEPYRQRWAIENLWKFLKMQDRLMTKSLNGIIHDIDCVFNFGACGHTRILWEKSVR